MSPGCPSIRLLRWSVTGAVVSITGDGVHNWERARPGRSLPGQGSQRRQRRPVRPTGGRAAHFATLGRHIAYPRRQLCWHEQSRTHQRPVAEPGARRGRAGPVGTLDGQILLPTATAQSGANSTRFSNMTKTLNTGWRAAGVSPMISTVLVGL